MTAERQNIKSHSLTEPGPAWLAEALRVVDAPGSGMEFHANRFFKVTLLPLDGCTRRVHVWLNPGATGPSPSNVHGHCWSFSSFVLAGQLVEHLYEPVPGNDYDEYKFYSGREPLILRGQADLVVRETLVHDSGTAYTRKAEDLHTVTPSGAPTVTAVRHSRDRLPAAQVFVRAGAGRNPGQSSIPTRHDLGILRETLLEVCESWAVPTP